MCSLVRLTSNYKTFYTLNICIEVAQRETVLYQAGEGASGFESRVSAHCVHHGIGRGSLYFASNPSTYWMSPLLNHSSCNLMQSRKIADRIAIVVFDTFARALVGADENSSRDVGIGIANASRIQKALGCAIVVIHHSNRAERGERGSGALRGAADAMIEITNEDGLISVACSKLKDGPAFPTEYFRFVAGGDSGLLLPAHDVAVEYSKLSTQQLKVLTSLALEIFTDSGIACRQLMELTKLPESSLYRVLSTLKRAGFVTQGTKGDPYKLTEQGRQQLQRETDGLSKPNAQMLIEKFKRTRLKEPTRSRRQRSVASVNRELACISKIFSLAIRDGKTDTNPCRQVQKYEEHNERNRYLLPEEEERLLGELSGSRAHLEPIIRIAINTGMRRGEILAMRWSWIDFARGSYTFRAKPLRPPNRAAFR